MLKYGYELKYENGFYTFTKNGELLYYGKDLEECLKQYNEDDENNNNNNKKVEVW